MRKILMILVSIIFILATVFLGYQIIIKTMFSNAVKYVVCFAGLLISAFLLYHYFKANNRKILYKMPKKKKKKIKFWRVASHILMLILTITLVLGNLYFYNLDSFMDDITASSTTAEEETTEYTVYALNSSTITSLSDDFNYIGVSNEERGALYLPFKNYMSEEYSKTIDEDYTLQNYLELSYYINALYDGYIELVICSDDLYAEIVEYDSTFPSKTKAIATIGLANGVESTPVDVTSEAFNVLILGVDIRESEGTIKTDCRCDTIMVASFNPTTMKMSLISIPRDSYVLVNGLYDKMTHSGNYGVACTIDAVESLLGITINYYAKFNFQALVDIVDALGGIDVDVQYSFCEQDSNDVPDSVCLDEGYQHLDGEQALAYARHRKTVTDHIRNQAQQQVIEAIADELVSFSILTSFNSLLESLSGNMMTNFTKQELYNLATLCPSLGSLEFSTMVIGGEDTEVYYSQYLSTLSTTILDEEQIEQAKQQIADIFESN